MEFLAFLELVAEAHPRRKPQVGCDNYATHEHPDVVAWPAKNPRVTLHSTPTSGSWLTMVSKRPRRMARRVMIPKKIPTVRDLEDAIRAFFDGWNERCEQSAAWTKDAETIRARAEREPTSHTRHENCYE